MAENWNSWSCSSDNSGWDANVVLSTANIGGNTDYRSNKNDSSKHSNASLGNEKNNYQNTRHYSPPPPRFGNQKNTYKNSGNIQKGPNNNRSDGYKQHHESNQGNRYNNNQGNRYNNNQGNRYNNNQGNKYNNNQGNNQNTRGGRNSEANHFVNAGPKRDSKNRSDSQSSGFTPQNFQNPKSNSQHDKGNSQHNKSNSQHDKGNSQHNKSNSQHDKSTSHQHDKKYSNQNYSNNKNNNWKKEECTLQDFDEPPELFSVETKSNITGNDPNDSVSSKVSTKSESITSSDPHDIETKILNLIHDLKRTLHTVETKPSRHVQNEIKSLKKYIGFIVDRWNPKSNQWDSSSESESSESSSSEEEKKKKKKRQRKRNKQKKNKNKEKDAQNEEKAKDVQNEDKAREPKQKSTEKIADKNQERENPDGVVDINVGKFQENLATFINQEPVSSTSAQKQELLNKTGVQQQQQQPLMSNPGIQQQQLNTPHVQLQSLMGNRGVQQPPRSLLGMHQPMPLLYPPHMMPVFPMMPQDNRHRQQRVGAPLINMNKQPAKPGAKKNVKNNSPLISHQQSGGNKLLNLNSNIQTVVNDIKTSGVTMEEDALEEMKSALGKLSTVDGSNVASTSVDELEAINICMLKVLKNETFPREFKNNVFCQLKSFFESIGETSMRPLLNKLTTIYDDALELRNHSLNKNLHLEQKDEKNYNSLKAVSQKGDILFYPRKIDELLNFKDRAKDALSSNHPAVDAVDLNENANENANENDNENDNDNESDTEASEEDSCEENEEASESEVKENTETRNSDTKRKRKPPGTFITELGVHCKYFLSSEETIEGQVNHLLTMFAQAQSPEYKAALKSLMHLIKDCVKRIYPGCILHLFGSRVSNLALADSDLDIFIDVTGKVYLNSALYVDQQMFVKKLVKVFYQRPDSFTCILPLRTTKVPLIKIHHIQSTLNCDLSFKNGISVENTKLLSYYLSIDPRVRWLATAVKLWAKYNHLHGSDYLTSHGLCWLVLFYLMQVQIVPPVCRLKLGVQPRLIDNWDVSFKKLNGWTPADNPSSNVRLFKEFFRFLREPLLRNTVLCTYNGSFITKDTLMDLDKMEKYGDGIFKDYVKRIRLNPAPNESEAKNHQSSVPLSIQEDQLLIQDPFEFNKNVSTPVIGKKFENFVTVCKLTLQQLESSCE